MLSALFCGITRPSVVIPHRRAGKTYRSHLEGSRSPRSNFCPLKMERKVGTYRGADKSLARSVRKQANVSVRVAWISSAPCPAEKKNLMTAGIYGSRPRNIPHQSSSRVSIRPILYLDKSVKEDHSCISMTSLMGFILTAAVGQQQWEVMLLLHFNSNNI